MPESSGSRIATDCTCFAGQCNLHNPTYPMLRKWGEYMRSTSWYIAQQVNLAESMHAPWNAIYERDHVWQTADEVSNPSARHFLGLEPLTGSEPFVIEDHGATVTEAHDSWSLITFPNLGSLTRWVSKYAENYQTVEILRAVCNLPVNGPIVLKVTYGPPRGCENCLDPRNGLHAIDCPKNPVYES